MKKKNKRLITISKFIIFNLLRFLSLFINKNRNIWIFGEFYGKNFTGNPKYFYLFLLKSQQQNIRPIWISNKKEIVNKIRKLKGEAYQTNSLKALYYGLIGKVYIFSHGIEDVGNYAVRNAFLVNLWHGMPIKNIKKFNQLKAEKISSLRRRKIELIQKLIKFECNGDYDIITATSELTAKTFESAFIKSPKRIAITGEPKNDIFFSKTREDVLKDYNLDEWISKTIVTYMPTFRDKKHPSISDINFWNELHEFNNDIIFLLHWHPSDLLNKQIITTKTPFVYNANDLPIDVQELLLISNILVTDYSSCFIDYLLLDRPIVCFAYDLEEYLQYRGFLYDYSKIAPGEITKTKHETIEAIIKYIKNPDADKDRRERIKDLFHKHKNGNFSRNVFEAINKLITENNRRSI